MTVVMGTVGNIVKATAFSFARIAFRFRSKSSRQSCFGSDSSDSRCGYWLDRAA